MAKLFYFAYGSNLHPLRLGKRVSSAHPVGPAELRGYCLDFHKRGFRDHSGKCTLTADETGSVLGAIYSLSEGHRAELDVHEGLGAGYEAVELTVERAGEVYECFSYLATPDARDPTLLPFDWYRALVVAGAQHYAFPEAYIERIRNIPVVSDPDRKRAAEHRRLLDEMLDYPQFPEEESLEKP